MKKIGLFGTYSDQPQYSRTASLRKALVDSNFDVSEIRAPGNLKADRSSYFQSRGNLLNALIRLCKDWLALMAQTRELRKQQLVVVPYPAHADLLLARVLLLGSGTPLIMDAFLGLKDTIVNDRQLVATTSFSAKLLSIWEKTAFRLADKVVFDTAVQCQRAAAEYGLAEAKFASIPVGIDERIWTASDTNMDSNTYRVVFWGSFIPLHGIEHIVEAASLLDQSAANIEILIIGKGQTEDLVERSIHKTKPKNLNWIRSILPMEELAMQARQSQCILGIFGGSEKAASVIPYKAYQALASNRTLVTRQSNALDANLQEFGIHQIAPQNPQALADKLLELSQSDQTPNQNARAYYDRHLSQQVIKAQTADLVDELLA